MGLKELVDEQMAAYHQGDYADHGSAEDMLTRFANAVAAVEREECARVCHLYAVDNRIHSLATRGAHDCEKAIRMRSTSEVTGLAPAQEETK